MADRRCLLVPSTRGVFLLPGEIQQITSLDMSLQITLYHFLDLSAIQQITSLDISLQITLYHLLDLSAIQQITSLDISLQITIITSHHNKSPLGHITISSNDENSESLSPNLKIPNLEPLKLQTTPSKIRCSRERGSASSSAASRSPASRASSRSSSSTSTSDSHSFYGRSSHGSVCAFSTCIGLLALRCFAYPTPYILHPKCCMLYAIVCCMLQARRNNIHSHRTLFTPFVPASTSYTQRSKNQIQNCYSVHDIPNAKS